MQLHLFNSSNYSPSKYNQSINAPFPSMTGLPFFRGLPPFPGGEPSLVILQRLLAGFWEPRAGIRQTEPQRR